MPKVVMVGRGLNKGRDRDSEAVTKISVRSKLDSLSDCLTNWLL